MLMALPMMGIIGFMRTCHLSISRLPAVFDSVQLTERLRQKQRQYPPKHPKPKRFGAAPQVDRQAAAHAALLDGRRVRHAVVQTVRIIVEHQEFTLDHNGLHAVLDGCFGAYFDHAFRATSRTE